MYFSILAPCVWALSHFGSWITTLASPIPVPWPGYDPTGLPLSTDTGYRSISRVFYLEEIEDYSLLALPVRESHPQMHFPLSWGMAAIRLQTSWGLELLACCSSYGVHSTALHVVLHTLKGVPDPLGASPVPFV